MSATRPASGATVPSQRSPHHPRSGPAAALCLASLLSRPYTSVLGGGHECWLRGEAVAVGAPPLAVEWLSSSSFSYFRSPLSPTPPPSILRVPLLLIHDCPPPPLPSLVALPGAASARNDAQESCVPLPLLPRVRHSLLIHSDCIRISSGFLISFGPYSSDDFWWPW